MKLKYLSSIFLILMACNKDEEILAPDDNNPGEKPSETIKVKSLDYTVIEYTPAPGQFINETAGGFDNITSPSEAAEKANERLHANEYLSLGAWGGYIVIALNRPIEVTDGYDFTIAGNAFDSSNEAGIVWVMNDTNGNGLPDDTWYELKGSYFMKEGYEQNFNVTYFRPEKGCDTYWEASNGESGYVSWLGNYHKQDFYYPNWIEEDSYTLYGSKLPARAEQNPVTGQWSNAPFEWGYADNAGEDSIIVNYNGRNLQLNPFSILQADMPNANPVNISLIHFIKVQTGILSQAGLLGENSTEICGFFTVPEN